MGEPILNKIKVDSIKEEATAAFLMCSKEEAAWLVAGFVVKAARDGHNDEEIKQAVSDAFGIPREKRAFHG